MPKRAYIEKSFRPATLKTIRQANAIIEEYMDDGYDLTLRQLYYQMVAREIIPNRQKEYNRLGRIVSEARLAGQIDWEAIVDRTRNVRRNPHWNGPREILQSSASQYRVDAWTTQNRRVEVFIEKDALVGVISRVCSRLDVPYFSCRGYTSQSEMWKAGRRIYKHALGGQPVTILHLGDHDPSGLDMTRDIRERLEVFIGQDYMTKNDLDRVKVARIRELVTVKRIALNREQVDAFNPPPNPAKTSDSRYEDYLRRHGTKSWELDALDPRTLEALIEDEVRALRDDERYEARMEEQREARALLRRISKNVDRIERYLSSRSEET